MFGRKKKDRRDRDQSQDVATGDGYDDDSYESGEYYSDAEYADGDYADGSGYSDASEYSDDYAEGEYYAEDGEYADGQYEEQGWSEGDAEAGSPDDEGAEYSGPDPINEGPYSFEDLDGDNPVEGDGWNRIDLGSVFVPMPPNSQLQVEMSSAGAPQAVHIVTEHGRVTVAAYAAPKSPGQWREVAADLADSLRTDNAKVSVENGPWGREVFASTGQADLRFIGIDGYRWMVRCVVAGPQGNVAANSPLVATAREMLADTVVKRGDDPQPTRTPLPVVLPESLAQQLAQAHEQQLAARAQQEEVARQQAAAAAAQPQNPLFQNSPQAGQPQAPQPNPQAQNPGGQIPGGQNPTAQNPLFQRPPGQTPPAPPTQPQASAKPVAEQDKNRRRGAGGSAMQQLGG
ncbi:MAG: DUF3710 domain-containing protein [Rhodococcus sp.]|nr:DUF3710 domain-containing protein [Rhodococcus sp. (in: high G+C Gram-positive bacteria)]